MVGFSIWRQNKIMFVLASINTLFFLVAIVHTFAWLSVSVILLIFFTIETLSSNSHFVSSQIISTHGN